MALSLVKGQKISLAKESGGGLSQVIMGLGWDPVAEGEEIDLDASCTLFNENKQVVDFVSFQSLTSKDGAITHTGDNLTGEGEGDDEQIVVNLAEVSANVKYLVFTVNSYSGQSFDNVDNAFCRLVDSGSGKEIARYTLTEGGPNTAMIMAKLYRHQGEWKMHALGEPTDGYVVEELVPDMLKIL
ncbi:MAG: TerD family protein [Deltaproteobacteria bacterium]|jgi:tellurium resistance protein TerZ|nr:TerD family protein [Deltaproteobacteria bacterium]